MSEVAQAFILYFSMIFGITFALKLNTASAKPYEWRISLYRYSEYEEERKKARVYTKASIGMTLIPALVALLFLPFHFNTQHPAGFPWMIMEGLFITSLAFFPYANFHLVKLSLQARGWHPHFEKGKIQGLKEEEKKSTDMEKRVDKKWLIGYSSIVVGTFVAWYLPINFIR